MRIRTQLALAFVLLSILPLAGIVLYGFFSSQAAVRRAMEADAVELAERLDRRLEVTRADLGRRFLELGPLAAERLAVADPGELQLVGPLLQTLGADAAMLDAVEFVPERAPSPPARPGPGPSGP